MNRRIIYVITGALVLLLMAAGLAFPCGIVFWEPYTGITGGKATSPPTGKLCYINGEVTCSVSTATDIDKRIVIDSKGNVTVSYVNESLTYTWSANAGSFKGGVVKGRTVTWKAPSEPMTEILIYCSIEDAAVKAKGEGGSRDDMGLSLIHI